MKIKILPKPTRLASPLGEYSLSKNFSFNYEKNSMQVEVAQISAWARTDLVDRVKDQKKQINNFETKQKQALLAGLKTDTENRIKEGKVNNPEVLLLDAGSNNKILNDLMKIYAKQSKETHVLLFSVDLAANKALCLAQTPKVTIRNCYVPLKSQVH